MAATPVGPAGGIREPRHQQPAQAVSPADPVGEESTPGVVRQPVFETDQTVMIRSEIDAGTTSGWHHHGERQAFGQLVEGRARVKYGPDGGETMECSAGDCFTIELETVHRDIVEPGENAVVVVNFVGSGPVMVNGNGPGSGEFESGEIRLANSADPIASPQIGFNH